MEKDENYDFNLEVGSRLQEFCNYLGIKVNKFETVLGVGVGSISKSVSNGKAIGGKVLKKIIFIYPDLNIDWLFTGRGNMLWSKEYINNSFTVNREEFFVNNLIDLSKENNSYKDENERLINSNQKLEYEINENRKQSIDQIKDLRYIIEMQKDKILALEEKVLSLTKREESVLAIGTGR